MCGVIAEGMVSHLGLRSVLCRIHRIRPHELDAPLLRSGTAADHAILSFAATANHEPPGSRELGEGAPLDGRA